MEAVQNPAGLPQKPPFLMEAVQKLAGLPQNQPFLMEAVQKLAGLPHFLKRFGVDEIRLDDALGGNVSFAGRDGWVRRGVSGHVGIAGGRETGALFSRSWNRGDYEKDLCDLHKSILQGGDI